MRIKSAIAILMMLAPAAFGATVVASNAWVRAPAPGGDIASAYLTLQSDSNDQLTGVDASGFGMAMLHESKMENGIEKMTDLDVIALPAQQTITLAPNGKHLMLMDFAHPPHVGGTVTLTLHFAHAPDVKIAAPVRPIGATAP